MDVQTLILAALAALIVFTVWCYNRLVRRRAMMREGWSGIDVQLKRRAELVPVIVSAVKAYAAHEDTLFNNIAALRGAAQAQPDASPQKAEAEKALADGISHLMAVAENYPDLKADGNFLQLQETLVAIEDDLQNARRYYNATVRDLNILVESFPSNIVAHRLGFAVAPYFEITRSIERAAPAVTFDKGEGA